jgi:type I restriction enzyme S subunit
MIGSAQRALTIEGVKNLNITVPPLQDQRAIAFILSNLDNKIELNLQINKTLEDMAMAIYKHWFVDFGPFQSGEFVDSELGMIPKGWEVKRFGDLYDLKKGLSYKSKYYSDDGIPMINLKCFNRNGGFRYDGVKYYSGDFKDSHLVIPGDLMIAMTDLTQDRAVLGSPIICPEISTSSKVIASLDIGILQQNKKRHQNLNMFYYYEMRTRAYHEYILGYGNGSTVMHLDKKGVLEYNSILPEVSIIQRFNNIVGNFRERISSNNKANQTLTTLRDTLLPKLISGEVRVKDIKQTVAQVL